LSAIISPLGQAQWWDAILYGGLDVNGCFHRGEPGGLKRDAARSGEEAITLMDCRLMIVEL
ncbi:MAG: hypothetical protein ACFCU3_10945, partial [Verrucomicrobiales bacterium]